MGKARITFNSATRCFIVRWTNIGNFLRNEPRLFRSQMDAEDFCRERGLQVEYFYELN
jgi:hypothetical protein